MKEILNDVEFRKLLRKKQKYELLSWAIPLISILSLIIILFLTSNTDFTVYTIIVLILLIFLIVGGYIFDNKVTILIKKSYVKLNEYFQNDIVPKLIVKDNPTICFNAQEIDENVLDEVRLFNNFLEYKSQYNYTGKLDDKEFSFHELIFSSKVNYNTIGKKELNEDLKDSLNYHWYHFTLDKSYPSKALFLISKFENFQEELLNDLNSYVLLKKKIKNSDENDIELYLEKLEDSSYFLTSSVIDILNKESITRNLCLAIYVQDNQLHIIIEEFDDLINLTHRNKIVVEKLLDGYYREQRIIKQIFDAFNY